MPYFSIIIPLYNKANEVSKTLESVFSQTFTDFEVIVVNDGSTDDSLAKVEAFEDARIHIFTTGNKGVSHARNFGIKKATADLIAFLDADDLWFDHHLADLKALHEQFPECGMYCKAYEKRDATIIMPSHFKNIPHGIPWAGIVTDYFECSAINNIAWTSALMIPKKIFVTVGSFDPKITLGAGEDTDLWMRIALKYPVAFSNQVSALHQLDSGNRLTNSHTNERRFIDLDKYEDIAKENGSLKRYLDLNRYAIAIQYKLVGNDEKAEEYFKKIKSSSLNKKQLFLIRQSPRILRLFLKFKYILNKRRIHLSAYR